MRSNLEHLDAQRELEEVESRARSLRVKLNNDGKVTKKCDLMAIYIQATGQEKDPEKAACRRCQTKSGPWKQCVVTTDTTTSEIYKGACACCIYGGKASYCSLRKGTLLRVGKVIIANNNVQVCQQR